MQSRAESFDDVAELYDRHRPGYPPAVFDALKKHARLSGRSRILEVGCGTGQATRDLLKISRHVTCVEPGANLLAVSKRKFPEVQFVNATFEDYRSRSRFDMVIAATSWHWVDPAKGYQNLQALLAPGGHFANVRNYHVEPDPKSFLNRAESIFRPFSRSKQPANLTSRRQIDEARSAIVDHGFRLVFECEQAWQQTYPIDDYIALRQTYSPHRALSEGDQASLERQLRELAVTEFGGFVTQNYLAVLLLAQPPA